MARGLVRLLALTIVFSSFLLVSTQSTPAQGAFFPVHVLACDAIVEFGGSAQGLGYPPECRGVEGVTVTAYDRDGTRLDACATSAEGNCMLAIDYNGTRIFAQDAEAVPQNYRAFENVKRVFTYTEFAEVVFHNYRDGLIQRDAPRATVRVHTRICPERYAGDSFFEDCNSGVPETNQWIFGNDQVARAGKDGDALLRYVPAAPGSRIIGGQSHSTGDVFFYCSLTDDPETRVPTSVEVTAQYDGLTRDFAGLVDLEPQMDVTCDWYQIPLLDRGLWDTLVSPLAGPDAEISYPVPAGDLTLMLKRCPEEYIPETISGARDECTTPENGATIRATGEDGTEYDSSTSTADGAAQLSLSDQVVDGFWITLDGHANAEPDLLACYSVVFRQENAPEPIQQWATLDGAGWTIDGFGDDAQGYTCTWYLVPTGS